MLETRERPEHPKGICRNGAKHGASGAVKREKVRMGGECSGDCERSTAKKRGAATLEKKWGERMKVSGRGKGRKKGRNYEGRSDHPSFCSANKVGGRVLSTRRESTGSGAEEAESYR